MARPKPPPPSLSGRLQVDRWANSMIDEATSPTEPRILSATGFAREDISILHQQIRCTNLAWALGWTARVGAGSVVGIVGGSFSGLMLAVALSLSYDVIVYIFEKEGRLLPRFRDKGHRHLSPLLNSRPLGPNFDPAGSSPEFRPPIFAWSKGRASEVAAEWLREFETYDRALPIFVFGRSEIRRDKITALPNTLRIEFSGPDAGHWQPIDVDLLIDATGFGEEANPLRVTDHSYWEAGHRLIYDHLPASAAVLISGCGDSGVIEALHYALEGFRHEDVEALWPYRGPDLDAALGRARLDHIFKTDSLDDCDAIPEIGWWLLAWWNVIENSHFDWIGADRLVFDALERALAPLLRRRFPRRRRPLSHAERWDFANTLSEADQLAVRKAVRPVADETISRHISQLAQGWTLPPQFDVMRKMVRRRMRVELNDRTPTAYTRQLSSYNVWLMHLLLNLPNVSYRPGRITKVFRRRNDGRSEVKFKDSAPQTFDRVVTRYGAAGAVPVAQARAEDTQRRDWLLSQLSYIAADPLRAGKKRYVWPARETILCAYDDLMGTLVPPAGDISKELYISRLRLGGDSLPDDEPLKAYPQQRLSQELKQGQCPTFQSDAIMARVWKR